MAFASYRRVHAGKIVCRLARYECRASGPRVNRGHGIADVIELGVLDWSTPEKTLADRGKPRAARIFLARHKLPGKIPVQVQFLGCVKANPSNRQFGSS